MKRVVMFSGGVGSWAAAKRVSERYGVADMVLLFADVKMEDEDLYRFVEQAAANVGVPLTRIADGRDPWQVFFDERFLGNSAIDPCSKILKRELIDRWLRDNCDPADTVGYVGMDWTEMHRFEGSGAKRGLRRRMLEKGWVYEAPMCEKPYIDKDQMVDWLKAEGVLPPRLYAMGFPHNNCGGFCVKAGQAHFALLLKTMPERYHRHEEREQALRDHLGADVSILRDRRGGETKPLTLREFRERIESKACEPDLFEWGGCGCFAP